VPRPAPLPGAGGARPSLARAANPLLAASPGILAELLDESDELVCVTGPDGRIGYVNRAWQRALGYTEAEAAAFSVVDLIVPEQRAAYHAAVRRLLAGHTVDGFEVVLVAKDGRRVVCRGRATPQMAPAEGGGPPRCVGARAFYRDVTAERQHEAVRGRLVSTLQASPDYVAVVTRHGAFVYLNRAGRQLVGLAEDAPLEPLHDADLRPPDEQRRFERTILPAALRQGRWVGESALLGPGGEVVPVELTVIAHPSVREDDPGPYFLSTLARDLRPQRAACEARERLSEVASRIDDAVIIADATGRAIWVNAAFTRMTGYPAHEIVGRSPGSVLQGPGTDPDTAARLREAIRAGRGVQAELLNYRRDGTPYWLDLTISPVRGADGVLQRFVAVQRDASARRRAEQERLELATAVSMSPDGVGLTAADGTFTYVNAAHAAIHGYTVEELTGRSWHALYAPDELERLQRAMAPALAADGRWCGETVGLRRDGTRFPQELQLVRMPWGGVVCSVRDISERKAAARALEEQLVRDELTGLLNRRGFFAHAAAALARAARAGAPCVLLYGDVDRFKELNDGYGHAVGDDGLRLVADALRGAARPDDVTARLGGDEFVALLVGAAAPAADATRLRLRRTLAATPVVVDDGGAPVFLSAAFGAAVQPAADPTFAVADEADGGAAWAAARLERLLRDADAALYAEKRGRR
jgi:diguanylate cyclase (GGDEF)-like protein/PAS domain S-box-containing protein